MAEKKLKNTYLFYSDMEFFAGSEYMNLELINNLVQKKYGIVHFAYRHSDKYEIKIKSVLDPNVRRIRINSLKINFQSTYQYMNIVKSIFNLTYGLFLGLKLGKTINPTLTFINNGGYPGSYGALGFAIGIGATSNNKIVMKLNNTPLRRDTIKRKVEFLLDMAVKKVVDIFIFSSEKNCHILSEILKTKNNIIHIHNSVTEPIIHTHSSSLRKSLRISNDDLVIGIFGQLTWRKGQTEFIEDFSKTKYRDQLKIIIMGEGEDEYKIKALLNKLQLTKSILIIEHRTDFLEYMNMVDIVCQPSIAFEDSPNTLNHALSLGKPIIANNVGGIDEMVITNYNGYLNDNLESKVQNYESAISLLSEDPANRLMFGLNSRKLWEQEFSPEVILKRYSELIFNKIP